MQDNSRILHGDALEQLRMLPDESVDAMVTDPPAGIHFMKQEFDRDKGGRDQWIAWLAAIMREALRVLKPGAHALVWSIPRTSHWTATALEDAGFEIRDCIYHITGQGMPKSHDISKMLDKMAGAEREIVSISANTRPAHKKGARGFDQALGGEHTIIYKTLPATPEAAQWSGWGTGLKPAVECWWLVRKPLAEKSIAENVLKHGTGAIHIDACRIGYDIIERKAGRSGYSGGWRLQNVTTSSCAPGRWPAHLLFSHSPDCTQSACIAACPVAELDRQNRGASHYFQQFFYTPKASRKERSIGCEALPESNPQRYGNMPGTPGHARKQDMPEQNHHPTVKPLALCKYLTRLVTPPGGIVLDPFCGSGTIPVACIHEGFHFIGIEQEEEYVQIAQARIAYALSQIEEARG